VVNGYLMIQPMLYGGFFADSIVVLPVHPAMEEMAREFRGALGMALHSVSTLPFWLMVAGIAVAWIAYLWKPAIAATLRSRFDAVYRLLDNKYYFDWFNENVVSAGARLAGRGLWRGADNGLIDGLLVNGSARTVGAVAMVVRQVQTGHLYWYALVMVLGVVGLMTWQLWPALSNLLPR
jgi:NADH-quinone oxidoreductase subunit L